MSSGFAFLGVASQGTVAQCSGELPSGTATYYIFDSKSTFNNIKTTEYLPSAKLIQAVQINGYNIGPISSTSKSLSSTQSSTSTQRATSTQSPTSHQTFTLSSQTQSMPSNTAVPTANSSSGLGRGPIIGIAVGVSLSVIGIISLLATVWYFRRHRPKSQYLVAPSITGAKHYEIYGRQVRQEVDGTGMVHEMPERRQM